MSEFLHRALLWLCDKVTAWATALAILIVVLQLFTGFITDFILGLVLVGLVYFSVKLDRIADKFKKEN